MKKKLLALLLTVAMMVTFLPFSALVSAETETEINDGIVGKWHATQDDGRTSYGSSASTLYCWAGIGGMPAEVYNGESMYKLPFAANGTYLTVGEFGHNSKASLSYKPDDLTNADFGTAPYLAIRLIYRDNTNSINYNPAALKICLGKADNTAKQVYCTNRQKAPDGSTMLWLDAKDGSCTRMFPQGLSNYYDYSSLVFSGNMNGYLLIPISMFVPTTAASANIPDSAAYLKSEASILSFDFRNLNNAITEGTKSFSWVDKELLVGDMYILDDKDAFVSNYISENNISKYESGYDDGAFIAQRIPSHSMSVYNLNSGSSTDAQGYKASAITLYSVKGYATASTSGNYMHVASLTNGDAAYDITPNSTTGSAYNVFPNIMYTYDESNGQNAETLKTNTTSTLVKMNLKENKYFTYSLSTGVAIRVATAGNDNSTINLKPVLGSSISDTYQMLNQAGQVVKFIDMKTGAVSDVTLTSSGVPLKGNVDGWIVVPNVKKNTDGTGYWSAALWDNRATFTGVHATVSGITSSAQKIYMGNTYFLTDYEKFIDAHNDPVDGFHAANLTLQDDLTINLKVNRARYEDYYHGAPTSATVSLGGGQSTTIEPVLKNGQYVFTVKDIAPDKMGADLNATLNIDDETGTPLTYSVADYCYNKLAETDSDTFKTLLVDILNYGSAAQIYKNYSTDALVNAKLTTEQAALATGNITLSTENRNPAFRVHANPSVGWKSANLYFKENVSLRFKFEKAGYAAEDVKIAVSTTAPAEGELMASNVTYYGVKYIESDAFVAEYDAIGADDMRTPVYVTVCDADGNAISDTLVYSVEAYAASKQNSTNTALADLVVNMMKYGDASAAYRASMEG